MYSIPILFNIFNRPKSTQKVFEVIRQMQPSTVQLVSSLLLSMITIEIFIVARNIISKSKTLLLLLWGRLF